MTVVELAMRVLAIDTALEVCSAAVLDTEAGVLASESRPMARGHAEALMPQIAKLMSDARTSFADIDRIAVTTGPGSFTGLRVGLSAARGIAFAAGKPAFGLTTLAAFAAPYIADDDTIALAVAIDARHEHVYLQVFGPGGRTLVAPRLAGVRDAVRIAANGKTRLVGPAADILAAAWPASELAPVLVERDSVPDIAWVARLGAVASTSPDALKPLYLRAPDAQPQAAARLPRR